MDDIGDEKTEHPDRDEEVKPCWAPEDDLVENGCGLFAVFCTVDVPPMKLDSLIKSNRRRNTPDTGAALCVIASTEPSDHLGGTRTPTRILTNPSKGKSCQRAESHICQILQRPSDPG